MMRPQTLAVDPVNDEIIVGDTTARAVFVFDRKATATSNRSARCSATRRSSWMSSALPWIRCGM